MNERILLLLIVYRLAKEGKYCHCRQLAIWMLHFEHRSYSFSLHYKKNNDKLNFDYWADLRKLSWFFFGYKLNELVPKNEPHFINWIVHFIEKNTFKCFEFRKQYQMNIAFNFTPLGNDQLSPWHTLHNVLISHIISAWIA